MTWLIGQAAERVGVSPSALRLWERQGLVRPTRSRGRYRLYSEADLARLQQILALKFLGFSLEEIKVFLDASPMGLREALSQQKALLREQRWQIDNVIQAVEQAESILQTEEPGWDTVVDVIRAIRMEKQNDWQKKYFTDEQRAAMETLHTKAYSQEALDKLASREWTEEDQRGVDQQYNALYAGVKRVVAEGQEPSSAEAQELAGQAIALLEAFTGGDPEIEAGLQNWWNQYQEIPAEQRPYQSPLSEDESAFLERAKAIFTQRRKDAAGA